MRNTINSVLVIYKQDTQNLIKVEKSIKDYFKSEPIEVVEFLHINDLNEESASVLTPVLSTTLLGKIYFHWDLVVDCVENQYYRKQTKLTFRKICPYFHPQFIKYSVIRNAIKHRAMLKSNHNITVNELSITKENLINKIKNTELTSKQIHDIYNLLK